MFLASMQINHWMLRYKPIMKFFRRKLSYLPKPIILYHIKCSILKFHMHFSPPHAYISSFPVWWLTYLNKSVNYEVDSYPIFSVLLLFVWL
jgi:hypothetical protein